MQLLYESGKGILCSTIEEVVHGNGWKWVMVRLMIDVGCSVDGLYSIVEDDVWLREERSHGREASLSPACTSAHIYSTIQFQRMCLSKSIPIPKVVDPDVGNTLRTQS